MQYKTYRDIINVISQVIFYISDPLFNIDLKANNIFLEIIII